MKFFDMKVRAQAEGGETILGTEDLGTHACYFMLGFFLPGRAPRRLNPGDGHEEIFCIMAGRGILLGPEGRFEVTSGQAFHLKGNVLYHLENPGQEPLVYVAAGGHTPGEGHHHEGHHHHE